MQYATLLALAAALLGVEAKIAFTHTPGSSVDIGEPFSIEWDGASDNGAVTLTLKKGDSSNSQTVALLTGDGKGGHYVWTPSKSLTPGDGYSLEITQGVDETNYSGTFSIESGSSSGAAASSTSSSSSSSSGAATTGGAAVTTVAITSGTKTMYTTESGGGSTGTSSPQNTTMTSNVTMTSATPTGGLQVSSNSPTTQASSSSSAIAAIMTGSVGGLAAALFGAAALL